MPLPSHCRPRTRPGHGCGPAGGVERLHVHRGRCGPGPRPAACPAAPRSPARSPPGHRRTTRARPPPRPTGPVLPSACPPAGSAPHRPDTDSAGVRHRCFRRRSGRRRRRSSCAGVFRHRCRAAVARRTRAARPRLPGQAVPASAAASAACRRQCARNGPIGLAGHRDRPEHGGQPAPMAVLHPRPRHAIAPGHPAAALLQPGTLIQMPLQQQPILLPRVDLQPGFQLTVPGSRSPPARPATPPPIPDTAGPGRPTPPHRRTSAPCRTVGAGPDGPWAGQTQQVQTGEDDITGSWFQIAWLRNLPIYQEPSHITAPTRRSHPNPAKPDTGAITQITSVPSAPGHSRRATPMSWSDIRYDTKCC